MIGIYKILNTVNGKIYIGQSSDIKWRWIHHKADLRGGCHHNKHLQAAWKKYGESAFEFSVIEECSSSDLDEREIYWISKYDSYNNGYNLDLGGNGIRGYKHTKAEIDKMRLIQNPATLLQFDTSFQLVAEWVGGPSQVVKTLKYTHACILLRCRHTLRGKMTPYKNSYWVYKEEYLSDNFSWKKYLENIPCISLSSILNLKSSEPICQYTSDGTLINKWYNVADLIDYGYNTNIIKNLCNECTPPIKHADCFWAYEGKDIKNGYYKKYFNCLST